MENTIQEITDKYFAKVFDVKEMKNGWGNSHLVVIIEEAIIDVEIGRVLIIPYAEGFKKPLKVLLQVHENGIPKTANVKFGIVLEYIYEESITSLNF